MSKHSFNKPKKSVSKRFKVTATGRLRVRKKSGRGHLLAHKSSKKKRQLKRSSLYEGANAYKMKKLLTI